METARKSQTSPGAPERALVEFAERIERHRMGRTALIVNLSRLQAYNRREQHMRIAISACESALKPLDGQFFVLSSHDLVFVGKDLTPGALQEPINRLRYLFADDPLVMAGDGGARGAFAEIYGLERDYPSFLAAVKSRVAAIEQEMRQGGGASETPLRKPVGPSLLGQLEQALVSADLSNLARFQPIAALDRDGVPHPVLWESYISIRDLENLVLPGIDLAANRWLFQYLTQALDRRILSLLAAQVEKSDRPISFNMNIATILSPEFQKFDSRVPGHLRGRLVVEIQLLDIVADMVAFNFAREFLRERGYRLCIDGLTHQTINFVDRARLGVDFLKLLWSQEHFEAAPPALLAELRDRIAQAGGDRVILCRCDSPEAIEAGRSFGVALYQGRLIDRIWRESESPRARA